MNLTREQIMKLEGRELDYHVAQFMGIDKCNWIPYSSSLDAAREAETKAIKTDEQAWATAVTTVLRIENWVLSAENIRRIAHMTPEQRCKAALLAHIEQMEG